MKIESFEHCFKGFGIHDSTCIVEVRHGKLATYITFIDTDEGTSVTNASEQLANETRHLAKHEVVRFFERYVRSTKEQEGGFKHIYDEIIYTETNGKFLAPKWRHLGLEAYDNIVNETVHEVTRNFKAWTEGHQGMTIDFFALKLETSNKSDLKKCFEMGNPSITFTYTGDKIDLIRIEEKGSDALRVLLREYF